MFLQHVIAFSKDFLIFWRGTELIFNGALGFFVIQDRFSNKISVFLVASFAFNEILVFWLEAFCKTVLWSFFY